MLETSSRSLSFRATIGALQPALELHSAIENGAFKWRRVQRPSDDDLGPSRRHHDGDRVGRASCNEAQHPVTNRWNHHHCDGDRCIVPREGGVAAAISIDTSCDRVLAFPSSFSLREKSIS
jgi:hypothetical protein